MGEGTRREWGGGKDGKEWGGRNNGEEGREGMGRRWMWGWMRIGIKMNHKTKSLTLQEYAVRFWIAPAAPSSVSGHALYFSMSAI